MSARSSERRNSGSAEGRSVGWLGRTSKRGKAKTKGGVLFLIDNAVRTDCGIVRNAPPSVPGSVAWTRQAAQRRYGANNAAWGWRICQSH